MAGSEIGDERVHPSHAVLVGPGAERLVELKHGERGAHHIGRLGGDDRGAGVHVDHELLGLRRDVGRGERVRREVVAREHLGAVANDHLLRQPLGHVRGDATGILADQLDLAAGDGVAVLLHVKLDAVVDLGAGIGELAGVRHHHPDLERLLRIGRRSDRANQQRPQCNECLAHRIPPRLSARLASPGPLRATLREQANPH